MKKAALILTLAALALAISVGWQVVSSYLANAELQSDLKDIASQNGFHIGLYAPSSEEDLRNEIIKKAKEEGIELQPKEVTVKRTVTEDTLILDLAVDYNARVGLPGLMFDLHFTAASPHTIIKTKE
ncbi:MAG: hypothetical protein WBP79_01905 [Candidatus Acidiferrales bacterium]